MPSLAPPRGMLQRARNFSLAALASALLSTAGFAEEVPLTRMPSGHLVVNVQIDSRGPFPFVLDTGANTTAIAQPVAESLGFTSAWEEFNDVQSLTTLFSAERFLLKDMRIADLPPATLNAVVIPVGDDQPNPVAGLLGADALPSARYSIDFADARLTLNSPAPDHADGWVDGRLLLIGRASLSGSLRDVHVMIDSGSARSLVNRRLQTRIISTSRAVTVNIHGVDSRLPEPAQPTLLRDFAMGGLCITPIIALQADLDIFETLGWNSEPAIVLGMDALQYARITVDRDAGTFEISAADPQNACTGERVQTHAPPD